MRIEPVWGAIAGRWLLLLLLSAISRFETVSTVSARRINACVVSAKPSLPGINSGVSPYNGSRTVAVFLQPLFALC
jgi:hypothetical protein